MIPTSQGLVIGLGFIFMFACGALVQWIFGGKKLVPKDDDPIRDLDRRLRSVEDLIAFRSAKFKSGQDGKVVASEIPPFEG